MSFNQPDSETLKRDVANGDIGSVESLALRWRPNHFEKVCGQEHVVRAIKFAVQNRKYSPAYIFAGTRGVGKTSMARLFSMAINCSEPLENRDSGNPCLKCDSCMGISVGDELDYQEIDGASFNGVENIRSVIESTRFAPTRGRFKILVIDEVHMLSTAAFNALLKTLEEPPPHCLFIFATTEIHKIPPTILSRCMQLSFTHVSKKDLKNHLSKVLESEQIEFSDESLIDRLVERAEGSVRDMMTLLQQVVLFAGGESVTEEGFAESLGIVTGQKVDQILDKLLSGDVAKLKSELESLFNGLNGQFLLDDFCVQIQKNLFKRIQSDTKQNSVDQNPLSLDELLWIYETLSQDFAWGINSLCPEETIQLVLFKVAARNTFFKRTQSAESSQDQSESLDPASEGEIAELKQEKHKPTFFEKWREFLISLGEDYPILKTNLEIAVVHEQSYYNDEQVLVSLVYNLEDELFREQVITKNNYENFKQRLISYFNVSESQTEIRIEIANSKSEDESLEELNTEVSLTHNEESEAKDEGEQINSTAIPPEDRALESTQAVDSIPNSENLNTSYHEATDANREVDLHTSELENPATSSIQELGQRAGISVEQYEIEDQKRIIRENFEKIKNSEEMELLQKLFPSKRKQIRLTQYNAKEELQ